MDDPVTDSHGHSFEKKEISRYLSHKSLCPSDEGEPLDVSDLQDNSELKEEIIKWRRQRKTCWAASKTLTSLAVVTFVLIYFYWPVYAGEGSTDAQGTKSEVLEGLQKDMPITYNKLSSAILLAQLDQRPYALSVHLFGNQQTAVMNSVLPLFEPHHPSCATRTHYLRSVSYSAILDEIYVVALDFPCALFVWENVRNVPDSDHGVFKVLFDDHPQRLQNSQALGGRSVDVRQLTFVILSDQTPANVIGVLAEATDPIASMDRVNHAIHEDVSRFRLWPDRITHIIRYHIPFVESQKG